MNIAEALYAIADLKELLLDQAKREDEMAAREALLTRKTEELAQLAKAFSEECAVTRADLATDRRDQLEAIAKERQQLQTAKAEIKARAA
jgi:hypothetical protein